VNGPAKSADGGNFAVAPRVAKAPPRIKYIAISIS
jgi:hypothetical protein